MMMVLGIEYPRIYLWITSFLKSDPASSPSLALVFRAADYSSRTVYPLCSLSLTLSFSEWHQTEEEEDAQEKLFGRSALLLSLPPLTTLSCLILESAEKNLDPTSYLHSFVSSSDRQGELTSFLPAIE